jgi:hypothetical protein
LTGHSASVWWGAWGLVDDRPVLATGGNDETVRLWDPVAQAALGAPLTGHTSMVRWGNWGVVDGRPVLATGGNERTVRLWEVVEDRPIPRLPPYRSDATAATDALDRAGDAVALAELLTARTARPPLAVGLFGDWGEGKSHFLGLLRQQVQATARPDNLLAHSAVRQVWFNAWHYAETDLWASLVAELFAQLAAPPDGDLGAEHRRQSRLAGELVAERGLRERLQAARARREELGQALREPVGPWESLTPEQQAQLGVLAGGDPAQAYRMGRPDGRGAARDRPPVVAVSPRRPARHRRPVPRPHSGAASYSGLDRLGAAGGVAVGPGTARHRQPRGDRRVGGPLCRGGPSARECGVAGGPAVR